MEREAAQVAAGATLVGQDGAEVVHAATIAVVGRVPVELLRHANPVVPDEERDLAVLARAARPVTGVLDLLPGDPFPDVELPDHDGHPRRLSELAGGDPLLLHTYRGWWCPKERAWFRHLVALQDDAEVAYTRFASLSVDPPPVSAAFRAGLDARWPFLSDVDGAALEALGLRETTDTLHDPYLPTVWLLGPDLRVSRWWLGYWYWARPTVAELHAGLRELSAGLRPDWDPPRPAVEG